MYSGEKRQYYVSMAKLIEKQPVFQPTSLRNNYNTFMHLPRWD